MQSFAPNNPVTIEFDLISPVSNELLVATAAVYSVFDDAGAQVVAETSVAVTGSEETIRVPVSGANNTVPAGEGGARTILLNVTTADGTLQLSETYLLEQFAFLTVPAESALTLPQSVMLTNQLASTVLEIWGDTTDHERQAALREAWTRIARFPLMPWKGWDVVPDQASSNLRSGRFSVNELSVTDWNMLPDTFKNALKRAQLIEAAVILEGDPTWDRRQDGLISKTVGESSEMFRSTKSANSVVSPKAYREISAYISRTVSVGRA